MKHLTTAEKRRMQYRRATARACGVAAGIFIMGMAAGVVADAYFTPGELTVIDNTVKPVAEHVSYIEPMETAENEQIEEALLAQANVIEDCTVTYYCAEEYEHICGLGLGITATGAECVPGSMVAVDPSVIPLHSQVMVDYGDGEIHYYVAEDTGGEIKGNHIDVMMATHAEALEAGKTTATVYWISEEV